MNILKSKFTDYKDFHTMLYTCAAEFDFIETEVGMENAVMLFSLDNVHAEKLVQTCFLK